MKKFGWNVHGVDKPDYLDRLKPAVFMAFGGAWGSNLSFLTQAYDRLGETITYAYRAWSLDQGGDLDHFEYYLRDHDTDPTHFIDKVESARNHLPNEWLKREVLWHTFNETGHDRLREYFEWHTRAVEMANARNMRLLCLNFGAGHPSGTEEQIKASWRLGKDLFHAIADGGGKSVIGLHEYFPGSWRIWRGWLVERYKRMQAVVDELGIARPKIVFTEFGTDLALGAGSNHPDVIEHCPDIASGGWHAYAKCSFWKKKYGKDNQQAALAQEIIDVHREVYDQDPDVIGTCFFTWGKGSSDRWNDYTLARDSDELLELLVAARETPDAPPDPTPHLCEQALAAPRVSAAPPPQYKVTVDNLNIRKAPVVNACSSTGQTVSKDAVVDALAETKFDGRDWIMIEHEGQKRFLVKRRQIDGETFLERVEGPVQPPTASAWGVRTTNPDLMLLLRELANTTDGLEFFQE